MSLANGPGTICVIAFVVGIETTALRVSLSTLAASGMIAMTGSEKAAFRLTAANSTRAAIVWMPSLIGNTVVNGRFATGIIGNAKRVISKDGLLFENEKNKSLK
jgi:hypothetical protein